MITRILRWFRGWICKRRSPFQWVRFGLGWILLAAVAVLALYPVFITDWKMRPFCHKCVHIGFVLWMGDHHTTTFPNVSGSSSGSLQVIDDNIRVETWRDHYRYVPGLQESDPPDLVLMYLDQQTRWTWHGDPPTKFKDYAWIVVPVDFCEEIYMGKRKGGRGELSERISEEDFKRRLRATLDFVRTNNRPNWEKAVAEHTAFLKTLESKGH